MTDEEDSNLLAGLEQQMDDTQWVHVQRRPNPDLKGAFGFELQSNVDPDLQISLLFQAAYWAATNRFGVANAVFGYIDEDDDDEDDEDDPYLG